MSALAAHHFQCAGSSVLGFVMQCLLPTVCSLGKSQEGRGVLRSPAIHQKSSPRSAATDPSEPCSGCFHGSRFASPGHLRDFQLRFNVTPKQHSPIDLASPDLFSLLEACTEAYDAVQSRHPRSTICGGFASCFAHGPIACLTGTYIPCPELLCVYCGSWLISCGLPRSGCATTNTNNQCSAQPVTSSRLSHCCSGALAC